MAQHTHQLIPAFRTGLAALTVLGAGLHGRGVFVLRMG